MENGEKGGEQANDFLREKGNPKKQENIRGKLLVTERQHRLHAMEVKLVLRAIDIKLRKLLKARTHLTEAQILFRVHHRLYVYVVNRPKYPSHESFEAIAQYMNGTDLWGDSP